MAKKIFLTILFSFWFFLVSPFLGAVGMAAIFAVLFHPWMKKIDRGHFPNAIAAGLFTLGVTLIVFLPISTVMIASVNSGLTELKRIKRLDPKAAESASSEVVLDKIFESSGFDGFLARTSKVLPMDPEKVSNQLKDMVTNLSGRSVDALSIFIGRIPNMLVGFAVFLFALYYFLADGENFLLYVRKKSFFNKAETNKIFTTVVGLCRSVILASVITGGLQALLATIVSFIAGISQALMVFPIIFIFSFVPLIGAIPIVIGMAMYQFFSGHMVAGIGFAVCALLMAAMDNIIRPQIIRGGSNLHPLLTFISAISGLAFFGMAGVFLGPIICGLMVETLKIVQEDI